MNRFERAIKLHQILAGRRVGLSFEELEKRTGWKPTSLKRTIRFLRVAFDAPLNHDPERGGYLYDGNVRFELPGLWFSAEELSALLVLEDVLARQPFGLLSETLKPFGERLEKLAARAGIGVPEWRARLRLLRMAARPAGERFAIVADALTRRRRLSIDYHARHDDHMPPPREVSPQRLVLYRDNWYLDAWCHRRDDLRTFALDRIVAAEMLDQPAQDIDPARLDEILATGYGIFAGQPNAVAVLRFSPHAARWVAAETWHPKQEDEQDQSGALTRRIPYRHNNELLMDILRHGPDVEVLDPPALRDAVAARLRAALQAYGPTPQASGPLEQKHARAQQQ